MATLVLILAASLVFGGVWWGLTKLGTNVFVVAFLSLLFALLVYVSQSLFGFKL